MPEQANGPFEVKLTPQPSQEGCSDPSIGRLAIAKRFQGDLDATSLGQMLAFRSSVDGSAGYVAIERVVGKLHGRSGSFVLQHSGTMDRGTPGLSVTVVPDSGTEELAGLAGRMAIVAEGKQHTYSFDYTLPPPPG
ncbi:MAG: DUF3224 domain-containing protein [Isosphaeraceae bacterium]